MRKLKLQVQISVDGFVARPDGAMDWMTAAWTDDIKQYVESITEPVDTILLGRNLATGFIPYWEAVASDEQNPEKAAGIKYSETHKIVFSKTLTQSAWKNTDVENGDFVERINALKRLPGGDMIVYGGSRFVSSLIKQKLIDELHLFVNPAILGAGMSVFNSVVQTQQLQLISSRRFDCGILMLVYKPV